MVKCILSGNNDMTLNDAVYSGSTE